MVNYTGTERPCLAGRPSHAAAYAAGRAAYEAGRIKQEAWHLYEKLVRWAGDHGYCWWPLQKIGAFFRRCVRAVSNWMKQLVEAGLIRRKRTRGNAETWVTALESGQASFLDVADSDLDVQPDSNPTIKDARSNEEGKPVPGALDSTGEDDPDPALVARAEQLGLRVWSAIRDVARRGAAWLDEAEALQRRNPRIGPGLLAVWARAGAPLAELVPSTSPGRRYAAPPPLRRAYSPGDPVVIASLLAALDQEAGHA